MTDKRDLNYFEGHILNDEIDRAKVVYSRKRGILAFDSVSNQCYLGTPMLTGFKSAVSKVAS